MLQFTGDQAGIYSKELGNKGGLPQKQISTKNSDDNAQMKAHKELKYDNCHNNRKHCYNMRSSY